MQLFLLNFTLHRVNYKSILVAFIKKYIFNLYNEYFSSLGNSRNRKKIYKKKVSTWQLYIHDGLVSFVKILIKRSCSFKKETSMYLIYLCLIF